MKKYDVFISYRREGGYDTAKHLYDLLVRDGYRVCFDIDTLRKGDFDKSLLSGIDSCKDFILIVDENAFDRTLDPNVAPEKDWMRLELAYALKKDKNIIPVFLKSGNSFPDNLPEDIAEVTKKNGPLYNRYYFNDFYKRLKQDFLLSGSYRRKVMLIVISIIVLTVIGGILWSLQLSGPDNGGTPATVAIDSVSLISDSIEKIEKEAIETDTCRFPAFMNSSNPLFHDFDWISKRKIDINDIILIEQVNLRFLRNAIFATHGYVFKKDPDLKRYFEQFSWYNEAVKNNMNKNIELSEIEKHNLNVITSREENISKYQSSQTSESESIQSKNDETYYGKVGNSEIKMNLVFNKENKTLVGSYSYTRFSNPPKLAVNGIFDNGTILINEMNNLGQITGRFEGKYNKAMTEISGTFVNALTDVESSFTIAKK